MQYKIKEAINIITINGEKYLLAQLHFWGKLDPRYKGTYGQFEEAHRYGTMKLDRVYDKDNNLGNWLTSSTTDGAIENRKHQIEMSAIIAKYDNDYKNPDCMKELKAYMDSHITYIK